MFCREVITAFDEDISAARLLVDSASDILDESRLKELHKRLDLYVLPNLKGDTINVQSVKTPADSVAYLPSQAMPYIKNIITQYNREQNDPLMQLREDKLKQPKRVGGYVLSTAINDYGTVKEFTGFVNTASNDKTAHGSKLLHESIHVAQKFREAIPIDKPVPDLHETPLAYWIYNYLERLAMQETEAYSLQLAVMRDSENFVKIRRQMDNFKLYENLGKVIPIRRFSIATVNYFIETGQLSASCPPPPKILRRLIDGGIIE